MKMNKFLEAAQPHIPLMMYTLIAVAVFMLLVSIIKILLRRRAERIRALSRQNNVLFSRLLTPNELDDRDPVIAQQQETGSVLRGSRRPASSEGYSAVDLSMFNTRSANSEAAAPQPSKSLSQGLSGNGNNASTIDLDTSPVLQHRSVNAAAVKNVPIIEESNDIATSVFDVQNAKNDVLPVDYLLVTEQQPVQSSDDSEDVDALDIAEAEYEKVSVLSQWEYHLFERLLDRLETFHNGQGFMLLNNVRVGHLVRTSNTKAINLINHQSVDFVIVNEQRKAVIVIQNQNRPSRENAVIKAICTKVGIEYFELGDDDYDVSVMNKISKALNLSKHLEQNVA